LNAAGAGADMPPVVPRPGELAKLSLTALRRQVRANQEQLPLPDVSATMTFDGKSGSGSCCSEKVFSNTTFIPRLHHGRTVIFWFRAMRVRHYNRDSVVRMSCDFFAESPAQKFAVHYLPYSKTSKEWIAWPSAGRSFYSPVVCPAAQRPSNQCSPWSVTSGPRE